MSLQYRSPKSGEGIDQLRDGVDEVDAMLVQLLCARGRLVQGIQHLKGNTGRVPAREAAILERIQASNIGPYADETLRRVWGALFDAAVGLQQGPSHV